MRITESPYGTLPNGDPVSLFTLRNETGSCARITNYGGILHSLEAPDRDGNCCDIVLGKDTLEDYLAGHPYFGAITGRVAGRIGGAKFSLNGECYELAQNNHTNCLHGGLEGFDKMLWDAAIIDGQDVQKLRLELNDPDGHNNFPGNLKCTVTYCLTDDNALEITYHATCDKSTPLNPTNHSYFNLDGHDAGEITGHEVQILADTVGSIDTHSTLLGRKDPVQPGYNDYRKPVVLNSLGCLDPGNADIYFNHKDGRTAEPKLIASAYSEQSGRVLEVLSTEPGVQFYAGLALSADGPDVGKGGCTYPAKGALCFEAQGYPDSVNFPEMGDAVLHPGEVYASTTIYKFGLRA